MQPFSFEVRGDTVVGEMPYKKIFRQKDDQEQLAFMMREQGDKVFKLHPKKMNNFSLTSGVMMLGLYLVGIVGMEAL